MTSTTSSVGGVIIVLVASMIFVAGTLTSIYVLMILIGKLIEQILARLWIGYTTAGYVDWLLKKYRKPKKTKKIRMNKEGKADD